MARDLTKDLQEVAACFLFLLSLPITALGLVRLGFMRHMRHMGDALSFLHLDWLAHPELWYWRAHVNNLLILAVGLVLLVGSVAFFVVLGRQKADGARGSGQAAGKDRGGKDRGRC